MCRSSAKQYVGVDKFDVVVTSAPRGIRCGIVYGEVRAVRAGLERVRSENVFVGARVLAGAPL